MSTDDMPAEQYAHLEQFVAGRELGFIRALMTDFIDDVKEFDYKSLYKINAIRSSELLIGAGEAAWTSPATSGELSVSMHSIIFNIPTNTMLTAGGVRGSSIARVGSWLAMQRSQQARRGSSHMEIIRRFVEGSPRTCFLWALAPYASRRDSAVHTAVTKLDELADYKIKRFIEEHT